MSGFLAALMSAGPSAAPQIGAWHLPAYRPFLDPLPVWDYWIALLLPLVFAISLVYKSVRIDSMSRVPVQAVRLTIWIVTAMAGAAAGLLLLVKLMR